MLRSCVRRAVAASTSASASTSTSASSSSSLPHFKSAVDVVKHVLPLQGPSTTHELYQACHAIPAPPEQEYVAPHDRDYRIRGRPLKQVPAAPRPEHLIRSVRFLKHVLRSMEANDQIEHCTIAKWITRTEKAQLADLQEEAKRARERIAQSSSSSSKATKKTTTTTTTGEAFVWVDGDRFRQWKQQYEKQRPMLEEKLRLTTTSSGRAPPKGKSGKR